MLQFLLLVLVAVVVVDGFSSSLSPTTFVILGGTGRIGTAVATRLLQRDGTCRIILAGRDEIKGQKAVHEVLNKCTSTTVDQVEWKFVKDVWNLEELQTLVDEHADCLIHTAGPYLNQRPIPLQAAIASSRCKTYVDVSDPLDYLDASLQLNNQALESGTTALLCAGAFPGMSNVLAMEAAFHLQSVQVKNVRFNYFTAGLGGSGNVNLYITNLGFGEPQAQFENGKLRIYENLSGRLLGTVDFYLNDKDESTIGTQQVFAWPFPEAATVARELGITGDSSAAMGTAPDIWNDMLGLLVNIVPRKWWRSQRFSKFLADFSEPLVKLTDTILLGGLETHGMRIDVVGDKDTKDAVSIVQAHESFRSCVGQSCAEFALDLVQHPKQGVQLPEQRYRDDSARRRIIDRLTTTPGTTLYTGPVVSDHAPAPSNLDQVLEVANKAERRATA